MFNTHFRAKSNGIWVCGDYYNNCDRGVNQSFIVSDNEEIGSGYHFLIDSYTDSLSICTGLRDKNEKLIYENDIVKHKFRRIWQTEEHTSTVIWCQEFCCFYLFDGVSNHRMRDDIIYEIVGNKYDG